MVDPLPDFFFDWNPVTKLNVSPQVRRVVIGVRAGVASVDSAGSSWIRFC